MTDSDKPLLDVQDLKTWFGPPTRPVRAVDGVSFAVRPGRTVALVGESGCGKSVTALSLARLVDEPAGRYAGGRVLFDGRDVLRMNGRALRALRGGEIAYVFQDPSTALNPVLRIGHQIAEGLRLHRRDVAVVTAEVVRLLQTVGLPDADARRHGYPHELSGGMQQRVMIAMALACRPRLLVADEPTTALDATVQAQIMDLLAALQRERHMAILLITHNLGLVAEIAEELHVMYAGQLVESGPTEAVLRRPAHPYTRGLLQAVPRLQADGAEVKGIDGTVPDPADWPTGCRFAARCPRAGNRCTAETPAFTTAGEERGGRRVRCWMPLG